MTFTDALERTTKETKWIGPLQCDGFYRGALWSRRYTLSSDVVKGMAEALSAWVAYEQEQIKKDGPYVSLKIPQYIAQAEAAIAAYDKAVRELEKT